MAEEDKLGIATIPIRALLDDLDRDLSAARAKVGSAADGMKNVIGTAGKLAIGGAVAGLAAVTAAVTGIGVASISVGKEFDAAFDTIATNTGATGEKLETLKDDFKAVFSDIPTDAESASGVIAALNQRLDVTGKVGQEAAKSILEATRLMGGDAVQNTELLTRVLGDWGIAGEDASLTMDKIFAASQATGIGMDSLMGKVVQFGSPMRLMGFSLEDAIALFGKWEKEGVNAELAMGSLRIAAGQFARDNRPLKQALLETFDAIQNTTDSSAALALGMDVFGARAGPDMVAAIREGRFAVGDLMKAMENAEGSIERTAEATDDFPEKLEKLKNKAKVAIAPLGEAFMDVANIVVDKVGPLVESGLETAGMAIENFVSLFRDEGYVDFEKFYQKFGDVGEIIGRLVATIGQIANGQDVTQAITDLGTFLKYRISLIWNENVAPELSTWPGKFWAWLNDSTATAATEFEKLTGAFVEWTTSDAAMGMAGSVGDAIAAIIIGGIDALFGNQDQGDKTMGKMTISLTNAVNNLAGAFNNIGSEIATHIFTGLEEKISQLDWVKGIREQFQQLFDWFAQGPSNLLGQLGGYPSFDKGGTVPGPIGVPTLAVVHGGEMVIPAGSMTFGGASEHTIRFENVPAGIDQGGLERAVFAAMETVFAGAKGRVTR